MIYFNFLITTLFLFTNAQNYLPIFDIKGNISTFNVPVLEDGYYDSIIDSLIEKNALCGGIFKRSRPYPAKPWK